MDLQSIFNIPLKTVLNNHIFHTLQLIAPFRVRLMVIFPQLPV